VSISDFIQLLFRPNGPSVILQAQRADTMDAGGRSPPVAGPPTLPQAKRADSGSSGPAGRQCDGLCLALIIWRKLLCQPFGLS
jgi:hypothetical protein